MAAHHTSGTSFISILTLAWQRARQTWRMLLVTGVGMVCAVMVVCAVPMYSRVALTAGLRSTFGTYAQNGEIVVRSLPRLISSTLIEQATQRLNHEFQRSLGPYLSPPQFSIETQLFPLLKKSPGGTYEPSGTLPMMFTGSDTSQAGPHVQMVAGRLPRITGGDVLEIAVKPDTASFLHVTVGSTLYTRAGLYGNNRVDVSRVLTLRVVGIFNLASVNDPFWHGEDFSIASDSVDALAPNAALLSLLDSISQQAASRQEEFAATPVVLWYYRPDTSRITIDDLDALIQGVNTVEIAVSKDPFLEQIPYLQFTQAYVPYDVLTQFRDQVSIAQVPVNCFLALILGLALFFTSIIAGLLVDRQSDALAILRSRGASRSQVFAALAAQAAGLDLVALLVGPPLAAIIAALLAQRTLAPADQGAVTIITDRLLQAIWQVGIYALAAAAVVLLATIFALWRASNRDVLALRWEAARSTYHPLWQRLHLDSLAIILALAGGGALLYVNTTGALTTQLRLLLIAPLTLVASLCLLLAILLFVMRFFLRLLRSGASIAARSRGAAPLLALAQMARSPRHALRTALLLALAGSLAIFSLIFSASEAQHVKDVADFRAGADFSGTIPVALFTAGQLDSATAAYRSIPGVIAATLGFTTQATAGVAGGYALSLPVDFKAVDASTFTQTALWSTQDSQQPLASLMQQLIASRASSIGRQTVPAIIDVNAANTLHLSPGAPFILNFGLLNTTPVRFSVAAIVQQIPTPGDSSVPGILADYRTFAGVYTHNFTTAGDFAIPLNYAWLHTKDAAASLASVRKALNTLPTIQEIQQGALSNQADLRLDPLYDRRAMLTDLEHEPLNLTLTGVVLLSATTALLLALLGSLVASLLSIRSRRTNFALLRALGATPHHIASVFSWEQGILYSSAALLGIASGVLLSDLALPTLVFTSVLPSQLAGQITGSISSAEFFAAQNAPPLHIIFPPSLGVVLGTLGMICLLALGMMVYGVSRPSMQQVLRLNED